MSHTSKLERTLYNIGSISPGSDREIDTLRHVLRGHIGTVAQRSALLRIIKANTPKHDILRNLSRKLVSRGAPSEVFVARYNYERGRTITELTQ